MIEIPYPKKYSEAEVESAILSTLKNENIDARAQVTAPTYRVKNYGKRKRDFAMSRLDIVVFKNKKAICIIECKSWKEDYTAPSQIQQRRRAKQIVDYEMLYEIPVILCGRINHVNAVVEEVKGIINDR